MQYVYYEYYESSFLGTVIDSPSAFDSLVVRAQAYIERITFGRAKQSSETDEVKKAICAVCEVYYQYDAHAGVVSENNDGYSVTYSSDGRFVEKLLYETASLYLPAELLYRGVDE